MTNPTVNVNDAHQILTGMMDYIAQGKTLSAAQILQISMHLLMLAERNRCSVE